MVKSVTIVFSDDVLEEMDSERKKKKFSRNRLIEYLVKKWLKDGCKIIME